MAVYRGTDGRDTLRAGAGNDQLYGNLGADTLVGGSGSDRLEGGWADVNVVSQYWGDSVSIVHGTDGDIMTGGPGNDTYQVTATRDQQYAAYDYGYMYGSTLAESTNAYAPDQVIERPGEGTDTVESYVSYTLPQNVENLLLMTSVVDIDGTGNSLNNRLTGNDDDNKLSGMSGNDRIVGMGGDDSLYGSSGSDTMLGGAGNDAYTVGSAGDKVYETTTTSSSTDSGGTDVVKSSISFSLAAYTGVSFVENLTLTGASAINGTGNALANKIIGNAAANKLSGGGGNDKLFGNAGADTLSGGTGKDVLSGGDGPDRFVFNAALDTNKPDTITDFAHRTDKLVLDDDIFTALGITGTAGGVTLTGGKFRVGSSAQDADDRIIYNKSTGALYYDADGSGSDVAEQVAVIGTLAHPTLSSSDFLIIA